MHIKDFDGWNVVKKQLHQAEGRNVYFKEREIWFCALGINIGFEQDGKNDSFERPVLILKKFNQYVFWGVPLSTKIKPDNTHYLMLEHDGLKFSAIVSQLRLYSSNRLVRKLYQLGRAQYQLAVERVINEFHTGNSRVKKSDSAKRSPRSPKAIVSQSVADTGYNVNSYAIPELLSAVSGGHRD